MIRACKSELFTRWFAWTCERRLRRAFDVHVHGLERVRPTTDAHPIVLVSNHTSWWDPLVALVLCRRVLALDAFALMEEENLRRLRFFRLVGAVGLRRGDPVDAAKALRHGAVLLDRPGRALWVFGQGEERPPREELRLHDGGARIARISGAWIVPVALRYEFGAGPRPELSIACCEPVAPGSPAATAEVTERIGDALAGLDRRTLSRMPLWTQREASEGLAAAALDRIAGVWLALRGERLEKALRADPQRAIGPANSSRGQTAYERGK